MKFFGFLVLLATLSAAYGLKCYVCVLVDPKSCTDIVTCPSGLDRCASIELEGRVTRSCLASIACVSGINCCSTDLCNGAIPTGSSVLCNGAIPTGSSVLLLLVSAAITSVFL